MSNLKISFNVAPKLGPWGGGNLFIDNLRKYLESSGNKVIFDLFETDIDIILIIDPRMLSESVIYSIKEIDYYKTYINKSCKVLHRINECDERKGTEGINQYYIKANKVADYTIFVSEWLKNIYKNAGYLSKSQDVIMSGANSDIFNDSRRAKWKKEEPLRIVTHHRGNNYNKGFDIYQQLDKKISSDFKDQYIFTYIGNVNENIKLKSTNLISPKSGTELANEIKQNHIYLTASINEPSGNHHIEGAQCGLPILYRNSGGTPEFTKGYGISFEDSNDFFDSLEAIKRDYFNFYEKMSDYPFDSEKMCLEYLNLFKKLNEEGSQEISKVSDNINNVNVIGNFFYKYNKFLNYFNIYKFKIRIKKYLLIKFPIMKKERNVV